MLTTLALFRYMSKTCVVHKMGKQSSQLENRIFESKKSLLQVGTAVSLIWPFFVGDLAARCQVRWPLDVEPFCITGPKSC